MAKSVEFVLSKHARKRLKDRGVSVDDVRRAIIDPDHVEIDPQDDELTHAVKRFHRRGISKQLRVVYNHLVSPRRVVTVFFERERRRRR